MIASDWKRNNKVGMRNFNESVDFHDVVKLLLVRMLRRRYPDSNKYPIYTEYNPNNPNEDYPDIWMKIKNDIIIWEIQKEITDEWLEKIKKKKEDVIIVPLKKLITKPKDLNYLDNLKKQLEVYLI